MRAAVSLRQLAEDAGISNPYLSQIERGLRDPSAEVVDKIAKALSVNVRVLLADAETGEMPEVIAALQTDQVLDARQRQILIELYESFCRANQPRASGMPGESRSPSTKTPWECDTLFDPEEFDPKESHKRADRKGQTIDHLDAPSASTAPHEASTPDVLRFIEALTPGIDRNRYA
ncbi:hypothetical protein Sme01_19050 [Sphaerisporangium melleum]|uniref:HTH cro/C1-type domain-containing protein n=2 Tax=Sphaerisporangium melleum TaxID=321316 RepID=A0A917REX7_9ACTN|nr:hypothetical protein GCM10007964_51600 [Sphaerisporangium melleum]GII69429.1 hypothetical protein Sme01_19050 [Sphaerisporangium melleum]